MPDNLSRSKKRRSFSLRCFACQKEYNIDDYGKFYSCESCGNLLEVRWVAGASKTSSNTRNSGLRSGVWKYIDLIPLWNEENIVSLSEGGTVLVECKNLANMFGLASLYVKFEGLNPTGSFKDRGMTVGVSKAKELGYTSVMCASTGNTSASLAAYSARAGIRCVVLVPKGKIAMGKLAQAIAYGAEIFQVEGNFDDSLRVAREICERDPKTFLLNSLNPFRIEGQKTVSFEIVEELAGKVPDCVILPVGNGGNISAAWKGFSEIFEADSGRMLSGSHIGDKPPKMIGVQAEGAAPIARAFKAGKRASIKFVEDPQTEASAIDIGSPVSWMKALAAIYDSGGLADSVSDDEIFAAQRLIASKEGLFVEPASAAPIAYLAKVSKEKTSRGFVDLKEAIVVCICTGNGLKDPNALLKGVSPDQIRTISAEAKSLEKVLA
jgi:threonine synthase